MRIVAEIADALSYAHELGIVHRDVKPSNVMLTRKDRAVVTDFGIARILGATSHTQTGVGIGTPEYMAPEQGQGGAIDHRADIYSLGAMAYELFVGRVPFVADTPLAVVLAHIKDPLPLSSSQNPSVGKGIERALLKALAKDPAVRFDSAIAFAEALKAGFEEDTRGGTFPTIVVRGRAAGAPMAVATQTNMAPAGAALARPAGARVPRIPRPGLLGVAMLLVVAVVAGAVTVSGALRSSAPSSEPDAARDATPIPASTAGPTGAAATAGTTPPPTAAQTRAAVPPTAAAATAVTVPPPTAVRTAAAITAAPQTQAPSTVAPTVAPPPTVAPVLTAAPTSPPPTPKFAVPAKGALLYEAKLDGTPSDFLTPQITGTADVRSRPGTVEFTTANESSQASVRLNGPTVTTFVGELELNSKVAPPTDVYFQWQIKECAQQGGVNLTLWPASESIRIMDYLPDRTFTFLTGELPAPVGRGAVVAIVVETSRITVYVDQRQLAQVEHTRCGGTLRPQFSIGAGKGGGSVNVTGLRIYALP